MQISHRMAEIKKSAKEAGHSPWTQWLMGSMLTVILGLVAIIYNKMDTMMVAVVKQQQEQRDRLIVNEAQTSQNTRDIANIIGGAYTLHAAKHENSPNIPKQDE